MGTFDLDAPAYAPPLSWRRMRIMIAACLAGVAATFAMSLAQKSVAFDDTAVSASIALREGMASVKKLRSRLGVPIDPALDPAGSGLIGVDYSDITTTLGSLTAKQTSLNPQFAGLMVMWLKQLGLRPGDKAALSLTGSFPALNMAALYACAALKLEPIIVSSVGASSYGANIPNLTWLDIESHLSRERLVPWRSQYASLGGIVETEGGLDGTGFWAGESAIERHGAEYLREGGPEALERDIARRFSLYTSEQLPKVFINVGGAVTSLGWVPEAALLGNGPLSFVPRSNNPKRGLVFRMSEAGVPVIHLINIERLAADFHLPIAPRLLSAEVDTARVRATHQFLLVAVLLAWLGLATAFVLRHFRARPRNERFRKALRKGG